MRPPDACAFAVTTIAQSTAPTVTLTRFMAFPCASMRVVRLFAPSAGLKLPEGLCPVGVRELQPTSQFKRHRAARTAKRIRDHGDVFWRRKDQPSVAGVGARAKKKEAG